MKRLWLRFVFGYDQLRFALFRAQKGRRLSVRRVSPNLRFARLRIEPGAQLEIGPGFATERQAGNRISIQTGGRIELGPSCWLRTEYGENQLTAFSDARIQIGPRALINGAMLHAKREIRIGSDFWLGFGSRIFDADLHQMDADTPEGIEAVRIGDRVWIGADVLVLRGVQIGNDVVVGAGSIVTKDLPSGVLALGTPARPVRKIGSRVGCV